MLKLKTKWFNRWARKNSVSDKILLDGIRDLKKNLSAESLGSGLYKIRVAKTGKGKSSSFRTILVYNQSDRIIFVYGFSKSNKDNLSQDELKYFRKLAKDLLELDLQVLKKMLVNKDFVIIEE